MIKADPGNTGPGLGKLNRPLAQEGCLPIAGGRSQQGDGA